MDIQESIDKVSSADIIISITKKKLPRLPRKLKKWLQGGYYVTSKRPRTKTKLLKEILSGGRIYVHKIRRGN